jgi:hypothetical protein
VLNQAIRPRRQNLRARFNQRLSSVLQRLQSFQMPGYDVTGVLEPQNALQKRKLAYSFARMLACSMQGVNVTGRPSALGVVAEPLAGAPHGSHWSRIQSDDV